MGRRVGRGHGEEDVPEREKEEGKMRTAYSSSGTLTARLDSETVNRVTQR